MRRTQVRGGRYGLVILLAACPGRQFDLRSEPGATPDQPTFVIGQVDASCTLAPRDYANLSVLMVTRCREEAPADTPAGTPPEPRLGP